MVMNDITHIDVQVVRNLLISRMSEGRELMKSATVSTDWKKKEKIFQEKCRAALQMIDEGIKAKEGSSNDDSENKAATEGNKSDRKADVQSSKG